MSGLPDRTSIVSIGAELPELNRQVHPQQPQQVPQSLAAALVPVADQVRQIYTDMGLRPYRVFLVHIQWSSGTRGSGEGIELSRREILPTPRVRTMEGIPEILKATGLTEEGSVTVDQISAKFSEDDLMGRTRDLQDPAKPVTASHGVEFFWEVQEDRVAAPQAKRRRFYPNSVPNLIRGGMQWSVSLTRQDADRQRGGGNQRGQF